MLHNGAKSPRNQVTPENKYLGGGGRRCFGPRAYWKGWQRHNAEHLETLGYSLEEISYLLLLPKEKLRRRRRVKRPTPNRLYIPRTWRHHLGSAR